MIATTVANQVKQINAFVSEQRYCELGWGYLNIRYHILAVLVCRMQTSVGKHFTDNFVINGVGVKN